MPTTILKYGLLATIGALSFVAHAHASPSLGGVRVEANDDAVAVRVLADAPLENARVRTERGRIRVWFHDVLNRPRLEIDGDGRAIAKVGLAPGMEETIVLRIDLGHGVRVEPDEVRVEPTADGCLVHVPTGWLPPPAPVEEAPIAATPAVEEEPAPAAESAESAEPAPALGARREPPPEPSLGTRASTTLPLAPLGLVALALLGAWIYARKHRRAPHDAPDIQVLATHRLGPKHQLLVVRALGQDHLLAVHGQTTQVLGTTARAAEEPRASSFLSRLREVSDERAVPAPPPPSEEPERFGARLLSLVGGREAPAREPEAVTHDSVAGLLRLKARQGS